MAIDVRGLAPLLSVFDMPTSIKFYCEGLGFELATSDGKPAPHFHWVLLRLNGTELMLNTAYDEDQRPQAPDPARTGATRTP
jgi:glyoxylase I family protein